MSQRPDPPDNPESEPDATSARTVEPGPFTDFGQFGYGHIDKRVLDQDTYWVDIAGRPHVLADMTPEYLDNVLTFLLEASEEW